MKKRFFSIIIICILTVTAVFAVVADAARVDADDTIQEAALQNIADSQTEISTQAVADAAGSNADAMASADATVATYVDTAGSTSTDVAGSEATGSTSTDAAGSVAELAAAGCTVNVSSDGKDCCNIGDSVTLTITMSGSSEIYAYQGRLEYDTTVLSGDSDFIEVHDGSKTATYKVTLKAIAEGTATVKVTGTVSDGTTSLSGTASTDIKAFSANVSSGNTTFYLNESQADVAAQATLQLKAVLCDGIQSAPALTWTSSNTKIATVDSNGLVSVLRYGKATITAAASNDATLSSSCEIQGRFYDVNGSPKKGTDKEYQYFYNAVYWAADSDITHGLNDAYICFGAEQNCSRRELMIFLWRLAGKPEQTEYVNEETAFADPYTAFTDIDAGKYGTESATYQAIAWGVTTGIIKGFKEEDGTYTFRPDADITRKDIMIMIYRYAGRPDWSGYRTSSGREEMSFPDALEYGKSTDTYNSICWAYYTRITNGYSDGEYAGQFGCMLPCLRKDVVTFLYRYNNLIT